MEKIDILLWVMGGGFALMMVMWNNIHNSIRGSEFRVTNRLCDQGMKVDEINSKVAEMEKRLFVIENSIAYERMLRIEARPKFE